MDRNVRLALILSAGVMILYFVAMRLLVPAPPPGQAGRTQEQTPAKAAPSDAPDEQTPATASRPVEAPPAEASRKQTYVVDVDEPVETRRISIGTDSLEINLTNAGAAIESVELLGFEDPWEEKTLELVTTVGDDPRIFAMRIDPKENAHYFTYPFKIVDESDTRVAFSRPLFEGVHLVKTFSIDEENEYFFNVEIEFKNTTGADIELSYELAGPRRITTEQYKRGIDILGVGLDLGNGNKLRKEPMGRLAKGSRTFSLRSINWCGLANTYFAFVVETPGHEKVKNAIFSAVRDGESVANIAVHFESAVASVPANGSVKHSFRIYCGPKDERILREIPPLGRLITYGFFAPLSRVVLAILRFFQSIVGNWGVAIIMLTILVRLCLYPLTRKSLIQTQKMQALQPELKKLQEKYKNNKEKLAQEQMQLWRKHGANPMSGCLMPLLIQLPVFFALFGALRTTVDIRKASFLLWITDLSKPDLLFEIPATLPVIGNAIRVLPILSGALMLISQIISQKRSAPVVNDPKAEEQQKMQKSMMFMMSIVFPIMLYHWASGLMLYWTMSSLWGIAEQKLIRKHIVHSDTSKTT